MEFNYAYKGSSAVSDRADRTDMRFSPDVSRAPTYFRGFLAKNVPFREAISALHDVVVSDLRWKPKDRTEYLAWRAKQEEIDWTAVASQRQDVAAQIREIYDELNELSRRQHDRWMEYYKAQRRYFQYLYEKDRDAWFVLDPVITVHPDEIFFECFSQDESTYGRLGTSYEVYRSIGEFSCGTTNIDYSQALYDEFQKIRSYKDTALEVDPTGFEVKTAGEDDYKEVKIDLPDSWVRGFLQVSSAMSMQAEKIELHPMDVYNICFALRRKKELKGPRSLRYRLKPGAPITVVLDPWNLEISCPRSRYLGDRETEIRVWGRRRLHILERLIPVARKFTVYLLGTGMPSFYIADLGDMSFTLGLSGWTTNDWSTAGNFDLLAPRAEVDDLTKRRVFDGLKETWLAEPDALAQRLGLDRAVVLGALSAYAQAGRAIYDLNKGVYRVRELSREPLPMDRLRFANEREAEATALIEKGKVRVVVRDLAAGATELHGVVRVQDKAFGPSLVLDADQRLVQGECSCNFYQQNKLYKGPCEHMLAARMAYGRGNIAPAVTLPPARALSGSGAPGDATAGTESQSSADGEGLGGSVRKLIRRITGRDDELKDLRKSTQLVEVAIDRAMRQLIDQGLVEIAPKQRDRLIEELLAAALSANNVRTVVRRVVSALTESDLPGEIYGDDDQLEAVINAAFRSVAEASRD